MGYQRSSPVHFIWNCYIFIFAAYLLVNKIIFIKICVTLLPFLNNVYFEAKDFTHMARYMVHLFDRRYQISTQISVSDRVGKNCISASLHQSDGLKEKRNTFYHWFVNTRKGIVAHKKAYCYIWKTLILKMQWFLKDTCYRSISNWYCFLVS